MVGEGDRVKAIVLQTPKQSGKIFFAENTNVANFLDVQVSRRERRMSSDKYSSFALTVHPIIHI